MTRDEFHSEVECNTDYIGWHNAHELANKLYDSFENRKCHNCKWNHKDTNIDCELGVSRPLHGISTKYFWCNQWEDKK